VVRSGRSELVPAITDELLVASARDEDHLRILRKLGFVSYMCVPLRGRERNLGAISFVTTSESGHVYDEADLAMAEGVAARAALAIENAQLYRAAEERGRAARVLAAVGDGVFLLDVEGVVRYWNPA